MLLIDVNVLVGAFRTNVEHHAELAEWLEEAWRMLSLSA